MPKRPPQAALNDIPAPVVTEMVNSLIELRNLGKPQTDEEIEERCSQYFRLCANSSLRPGIEGLALALGVDRATVWNWCNGKFCSPKRAEIVRAARQAVISYIEAAQLSGRLNPVSSIFLLKNWANYKDSVQIEDTRQNTLQAGLTPEQIAQKIREDIPIDTNFEEITDQED